MTSPAGVGATSPDPDDGTSNGDYFSRRKSEPDEEHPIHDRTEAHAPDIAAIVREERDVHEEGSTNGIDFHSNYAKARKSNVQGDQDAVDLSKPQDAGPTTPIGSDISPSVPDDTPSVQVRSCRCRYSVRVAEKCVGVFTLHP